MSELRRTSDRRRARRAGFTLIELMVSLTIGAMVIATVYTIGGSSARNFQEQQRIGQLQLSARLALDRVRRDVERAGLHGTPNSRLERTCGNPVQPIQAVSITDNAAASRAALSAYQAAAANTTTQADQLDLVGNFSTSDAYLVRSFNGAGNVAFLQTQWQGFRRSFVDAGTASTASAINADLFASVFAPGRMLHIQNMSGSHFFVTITASTVTAADAMVTFTPSLPVGGTCVVGLGEGALIAPLSRVRYELDAAPADLVGLTDDHEVTGPDVALVRREINMATGAVMSTRTVLEWAVHFDVDAVFDMRPGAGAAPSALQFVFMNDVNAAAQSVAAPHRVRSLAVTVGARTPEQDPDFPWVAPVSAGGDAPPLSRFQVFSDRAGAARVRTATTEINIPNVANRGL